MSPMPEPDPARDALVDVLIHHQRHNAASCLCGWSILGLSHADHVADIALAALADTERNSA